MISHFATSARRDRYIAFLTSHLRRKCAAYNELEGAIVSLSARESADLMTTVELEKTFRGITCSLNVLEQLSEPAYPSTLRKSLSKHQIHKEFVSLIKICLRFQFKTPPRLKQLLKHKPKMMQMLRLWRSRILTFLDHFSNDKHFESHF